MEREREIERQRKRYWGVCVGFWGPPVSTSTSKSYVMVRNRQQSRLPGLQRERERVAVGGLSGPGGRAN